MDGVEVRRCANCREVKTLDGFYGDRRSYCRECDKAKVKANKKANPAKARVWRQKWRQRHPEAVREAFKRYAARRDANPVTHAEHLEKRRIDHRLKREREGKRVRPSKELSRAAIKVETEEARVPSAPLAALVSRTIEHRRVIGEAINDPSFSSVGEVCFDLGLGRRGSGDRKYRRWLNGEEPTVRLPVAERVLLHADVAAEDIYSPDDYRDALERLTSPEHVAELIEARG